MPDGEDAIAVPRQQFKIGTFADVVGEYDTLGRVFPQNPVCRLTLKAIAELRVFALRIAHQIFSSFFWLYDLEFKGLCVAPLLLQHSCNRPTATNRDLQRCSCMRGGVDDLHGAIPAR